MEEKNRVARQRTENVNRVQGQWVGSPCKHASLKSHIGLSHPQTTRVNNVS
jgi:hypothetical protein